MHVALAGPDQARDAAHRYHDRNTGGLTAAKSTAASIARKLGVPQTEADMADMTVYLATAAHVTGQAFAVDGGASH